MALPYAWLIGAWAEARPSRHSAYTNAEGLTRLGEALHLEVCCGGVLLSHNPSVAVPLALPGLASRFGMEAGRFPGAMTTTSFGVQHCPPRCWWGVWVDRGLYSGCGCFVDRCFVTRCVGCCLVLAH